MGNLYVDEIKVKISEKYKPPFRITMPMSYSQRLSLNKQLLEDIPSYNFDLERNALEGIKELKKYHKNLLTTRQEKSASAKQEFKKIKQENDDRIKHEKTLTKAEKIEDISAETTSSKPTQNQQNYVTRNGILMPIPASNYAYTRNNLNPLSNNAAYVQQQPQHSVSKSFNLSDFESDTSSPFDNMELKSINDLEELAQVLKSDKTNIYPIATTATTSSTTDQYNFKNIPISSTTQIPVGYQDSRIFPQNFSYNFNDAIGSNYQYQSPSYSSYQVPFSLNNQPNNGLFNLPSQISSQQQLKYSQSNYSTNCKSVPDLVKSLEKELDSTHLDEKCSKSSVTNSFFKTTNVSVPCRPKSTDSVYPKSFAKNNPLDKLTVEQKEICKKVVLMGFPLDRVIRISETVGWDHKNIVDHLLALSELLDLGFSETEASNALLKNNNDRDKALDLLIS